jgi:glycerate kinase
MYILIAPNAFKNSLSASAVAQAIAAGFERSGLACTCECFPVGDGGDGTAQLLIQKRAGQKIPVEVHGPLGRKISASFGLIDEGRTAVIEMADASGLRLLRAEELNPLRATSFGTGELIQAALEQGVREIILGVGGSATVDGATGILQALGARFLDASGKDLSPLPQALTRLEALDLTGLDPRLVQCKLTVLCDVENPLLGEHGAAAVFGPQKGATPAAVQMLEGALGKLSAVLGRQTGRQIATIPRGGAAGGVAAALHGFLNAELAKGIDYFLDMTGFDIALGKADLVVTGEGSIDDQTLHGKAPHGVALRAKAKSIPVVAFAGQVPREIGAPLQESFDVLLPIGASPGGIQEAMKYTAQDLERTALQFGNALALSIRFVPGDSGMP